MAAVTKPVAPPSSDKMESHAASAALSSARGATASRGSNPLFGEDGKLSSANAATSLKYARAQDLPSFPSSGLQMSSAGAAASLADSNKKSFEYWKPGEIPAANRAAMLAKDYEMNPLWQPEMSAAGSRAAILAHRDGGKRSSTGEANLNDQDLSSTQVLKGKSVNTSGGVDSTSDSHRKALLAATGAMSGSRRRAGSAPVQPKDDSSWALRAATKSHNTGTSPLGTFSAGDPGFEAARIQNIARSNVNRQMYGSTPPVSIEVDERTRQDMLKASAVAMAQKMYAIQQQHIDEAAGVQKSDGRATTQTGRSRPMSVGSSSIGDSSTPATRYENLEEAARRLAQERLAKLHDEHAEYRSYYGQTALPKSRMSTRLRRRASSGAQADDSDEEQSRQIRSQMSLFQSKLAEVDAKKRQADRDALLQAAHRNVEERMRKMDDKVFRETGKASPAQMEKWEKTAREKAQRDSDQRMQNVGKVHIGGGKYLDQSEVDAIAKARLQPTLDDINDKAEKQRARDEEIRLEQERLKSQAEKEKAREADIKAELKAATDREKQEQKLRRAEEKKAEKEQIAAEKEKAKLEKDERRKSKEHRGGRFSALLGRTSATAGTGAAAGTAAGTIGTETSAEGNNVQSATADATREIEHQDAADDEASDESSVVEAHYIAPSQSPTKADSKVKSWLKKPFRSGNKLQKEAEEDSAIRETPAESAQRVSDNSDRPMSNSMRDVALAGRTSNLETDEMYGVDETPVSPIRDTTTANRTSRSPSISSLSDDGKEEPTQRASGSAEQGQDEDRGRKGGLRQRLLKKVKPAKDKGKEPESRKDPQSGLEPTSTNTDDEAFEEARDTFQEEKLAPPAPLSTVAGREGSPQGSRERSKFTENL